MGVFKKKEVENYSEFHKKVIKALDKTQKNGDKFYRLNNILMNEAQYYVIFGERSDGKTFSTLELSLICYVLYGWQSAYVRRWDDDIKGGKGASLFNGVESLGLIEKITGGEYNSFVFYNRGYYLARRDEGSDKVVKDVKPFMSSFAINEDGHYKSTSFTNTKLIIFDEFITRQGYLNDEFERFMNLISTIIRKNSDVEIFMLANTVNKYCPYFKEMGLINANKMAQGDINVYEFGDSVLKVCVEYTDTSLRTKGKPSDKFFAFNNPKLKMITTGKWELGIYPHLQNKYDNKKVIFSYFVEFDENILKAEIVMEDDKTFTYIFRKKNPAVDFDKDYIFTTRYSDRWNIRNNILNGQDKVGYKILQYFKNNLVFYQDNEVGDIVNNYINDCKSKLL